ncbi:MAG TPA: TetR/AcrR family transcriptional regulator [Candidatus Binataceae bacterium]
MAIGSIFGSTIRPRLSQEEKTAETRKRLLDAAVLCLIEKGYANTTTSEIAERAGLSRGAQLYHFATKEDLLANAVEHLYELQLSEFREQLSIIADDHDRRTAAIDKLWSFMTAPLTRAWIELATASRTDSFLRDSIRTVSKRWQEAARDTFREVFPRPIADDSDFELTPFMLLFLMEGLVLELPTLDSNLSERIVSALKRMQIQFS